MAIPFALDYDRDFVGVQQMMNDYDGTAESSWWHAPKPLYCTCHAPGLPVRLSEQYQDWTHVGEVLIGSDEQAYVYHVHDFSSGRDCDGRHDRSSVIRPAGLRDYSYATSDMDDVWRIVCGWAPLYDEVEVKVIRDMNGLRTLSYSRATDEGSDRGQYSECTDPGCAYEDSSQRDYYAEAMGY
jgi:hypothetical protein